MPERRLTIVNSRHTFLFLWDEHQDSLDALMNRLCRLAENPEMDFDWEDADEIRAMALAVEATEGSPKSA